LLPQHKLKYATYVVAFIPCINGEQMILFFITYSAC